MEANEYMLAAIKEKSPKNKDDDKAPPTSGGGTSEADDSDVSDNNGTLILDATCAPANIRYPQDCSLLNEAREKLETLIIRFCKSYGLARPRMYRRQGRKNYLALAKTDNTDRIEVERSFSLSKRCYGMGLIRTKLEETTLTSIALSVFVMNLFKIQVRILSALILLIRILRCKTVDFKPEVV